MSLYKPAIAPKTGAEMLDVLGKAFPKDQERHTLILEALAATTAMMEAARDTVQTENEADAWQWLLLALSSGCQKGIENSGFLDGRIKKTWAYRAALSGALGGWEVGYSGPLSFIRESTWATEDEAAARCRFLNGE